MTDTGEPSDNDAVEQSDAASERPSEREIVQTAADAAEEVIFSRYSRSEIEDLDITISFEDDILEVDIYLNAPAGIKDPDRVADDAALAARAAVDDVLG